MSVTIKDKDTGWERIMALRNEPRRAVIISVPAVDPKTKAPYPLFVEYGHRLVPKGAKNREFIGPVEGEANTRFTGPTKHFVEGRPFMHYAWEEHDAYKQEARDLAWALFIRPGQGESFGVRATKALKDLGEKVVADVRRSIEYFHAIDTGRMWRSVRCNVVVERGGATVGGMSTTATVGGGT